MTVFDMGKNIPPASHLFCNQDTVDALQKLSELGDRESVPTEKTDHLLGLRIVLVEDPLERKARAFVQSSLTGHPVLYEDEDGNIMEVSMPKADPIFPRSPFSALRKP